MQFVKEECSSPANLSVMKVISIFHHEHLLIGCILGNVTETPVSVTKFWTPKSILLITAYKMKFIA